MIGGYEPSHAAVYRRLSATVSRWPESLQRMRHEGRLRRLPGVGPATHALLAELVDTGTCAKWEDWRRRVPESVLELRDIPGLGVARARTLYQGYGIDSLAALERVLEMGRLGDVKGMGPRAVSCVRRFLETRRLEASDPRRTSRDSG